MEASSNTRPTVAVIGGGYGGITVAKALDDVADVVLVDPKDAFVHNVAAWRALVEPEWLGRIFYPYERLLSEGRFLRDRATEVEGRTVTLASGAQLTPDYLVLATGSSYPFPAKIDDTNSAAASERVLASHEALAAAQRVLLIGAGPSGLELAGEIKAVFPDKHVTIVDQADDILEGPYDEALRVELRRQLAELGVELRLSTPLRALPAVALATAGAVTATTEAGEELTADIWFRCFGVTIHTEYARGALAAGRDGGGYIRVDDQLQAASERVFAIGDIADADRNMAGMAGAQAQVVAKNIRAMIAGEDERATYQRFPPVIAVPLGPEGGAGQLPGQEGVAGPEAIAELKGRAMLVGRFEAMFDGAAVA